MFLATARINFKSYPEKLLLFGACASVQLRNASRARQELKMKSVVPTYAYSTIFHNAVLPSVVDDVVIIIITACPHQK